MIDQGFAEEQIAELKDAFAMFDTNGNGSIEFYELQQVMCKLGHHPSESEIIEMIIKVDKNGDHEIDFDEFLILMKSIFGERDVDNELKRAFKKFDINNSGKINRREMKHLMFKLDPSLTSDTLDAVMKEVDTNGDGEISFEEFKAAMMY